jgi:hypothetical protein
MAGTQISQMNTDQRRARSIPLHKKHNIATFSVQLDVDVQTRHIDVGWLRIDVTLRSTSRASTHHLLLCQIQGLLQLASVLSTCLHQGSHAPTFAFNQLATRRQDLSQIARQVVALGKEQRGLRTSRAQ